MTILEAIMDQSRPLSVTPEQWMNMNSEVDKEVEEIAVDEVESDISEEIEKENSNYDDYDDFERLDIGIEKMISGFRIASVYADKIDKSDLSPSERKTISEIRKYLFRGVAPYLSDLISVRNKSYGGEQ